MSEAWGAVEDHGLRSHPAKQRAVMLADLDISPQWLGLAQLTGRYGDTALPPTNEVEVHTTPILYIDTVFDHSKEEQSQYRPADCPR